MDASLTFVMVIVVFFVLLFAGLSLGFAMAIGGLLGLSVVVGPSGAIQLFGLLAHSSVANFILIAVPLFIIMGEIISFSGTATGLFTASQKWFGAVPGGLALATNFACALLSAVTGISIAVVATIGVVAIPEMLKRGYDKAFATGSVCTGGALGILIPPSLPLIFYSLITEVSLGRLFIAAIIPGILLTLLRAGYILGRAIRQPNIAPPEHTSVSLKEKFVALGQVGPTMIIIIAIFVAIYTGIATPTESAALGAVAALGVAFSMKKLTFSKFQQALIKAARTTSMCVILLIGAFLLVGYLSMTRLPETFSLAIASWDVPAFVVIIGINILYLVLGCFLDVSGMILLTVPILLPVVTRLGYDPIWFGIMVVINAELALVTPPNGINLYVTKAVSPPEVSMSNILRGSIPFLMLDLAAIAIIVAFPQIVLWLPNTMK